MDATRIHLFLNYIPVTGTLLGTVLLLLGFWKNSSKIKRISLFIFVLTAVLAFAVYATGEIAGKGAELLVGPVWTNIETHKASALPGFAAIEAAGLLALIGLVKSFRKSELPLWAVLALLFLSLAAFGLSLRTTYLGRNIYSVDGTVNK